MEDMVHYPVLDEFNFECVLIVNVNLMQMGIQFRFAKFVCVEREQEKGRKVRGELHTRTECTCTVTC